MTKNVVRKNYSELWPPILEPWTRYLIACRNAFDGDLDKLLLLAAIATMSLANAKKVPASYDELKSGAKSIEPRHTNFHSLAQFTQIPRETVRRKTDELIIQGWVIRSDKGLSVSQSASGDLEDVSAMAFDLLLHIHKTISNGLARTNNRKSGRKK